jgi:hypothetical protein
MNRLSPEQQHDLPLATAAADVTPANADSNRRQQLRSGQRRGRREIETASRNRKRRRRTAQRRT